MIVETGRARWEDVEEAVMEEQPDSAILDGVALRESAIVIAGLERAPLLVLAQPFEHGAFHELMNELRAKASAQAVAALLEQIRRVG